MVKTKITFKDKLGVFFWRNLMMPFIAKIGGKVFPKGKVQEFAYGNHKDEKLDFIAPNSIKENRLAIVHIHGGAWVAGSKGGFYSKPLMKFSDAGYPIFSLNYPLAPEQQHPFLLRSLLKAFVWIKKNYPQYDTIHLIGDSAGGNLAMMLGIYLSNPELLKILDAVDLNNLPKVKSIVDIFGVNDTVSWVEDGFPSAKLFNKVYVENTTTPNIPIVPMDFEHIKNLPPLFIVGAGKDKLLRSSKIWAEHISKSFKDVKFKIYEGAAHGFFSFGKGCEELSKDMLTFFKENN
ncbi:alpha/beta hydrolase fold domain-containing protein [Flavobacterium sp. NST-5]|uniref:Alpha/beta hydrolase fold domain-containing protein n=1 Tax=Flavobacterium ichthyis TaxID=2698827 RepID=A0ABW9ZDX5_9FLAO|nr:alpha/beta hydrolase [Flavobacterium ichthyis]NBL65944.1 alpha/beta hydrolase fold domain-containing protein [Flavobacterium ichthyis]